MPGTIAHDAPSGAGRQGEVPSTEYRVPSTERRERLWRNPRLSTLIRGEEVVKRDELELGAPASRMVTQSTFGEFSSLHVHFELAVPRLGVQGGKPLPERRKLPGENSRTSRSTFSTLSMHCFPQGLKPGLL